MKKNILLFLLMAVFSACGGGGGGDNGTQPNKDYLSVAPNVSLLGDGQSQELQISANCSWAITKDVDWLTVSPTAGTNNQTVTITAGKNTSGYSRTAVLTVQGGSLVRRVTVSQAKATEVPVESSLTVNVSSIDFSREGGVKQFVITSNTSWRISVPSSWCTLSLSEGKGDATVSVTVPENPTTERRTGTLTIVGDGVDPVYITLVQQPGEVQSHQPGSGDNQPPGF